MENQDQMKAHGQAVNTGGLMGQQLNAYNGYPYQAPLNDWDRMSERERRRWVFDRAAGFVSGGAPIDEVCATADKILTWINDSSPPLPQQLNEAA